MKAIPLSELSNIWSKVKAYVSSAISGLYTKPSGGIPKSDMSSEVQTSLGKADTALQSHQDISGKQDVIQDLVAIRSGAALGATALQSFTETDPTVPSWAKQPSKPSYTASEVGALPDTTKYAGSQSVGGAANKAVSIPFGQVDSTSTSTAFTATVDGITELRDGVCCWIRNNVVSSTTDCTLNINGLGAKPMYSSISDASRITTHFAKSYTILFIYNSTRVEGGCWDFVVGYDSNTDTLGYKIRRVDASYTAKAYCDSGVILFSYDSEYLVPSYSGARSTGTSKSLTTESFNPFGPILFYAGGQVSAGGGLSSGYLYQQYSFDFRYGFNEGATLTTKKEVYVVCEPQTDGKVKLAASPIAQDLPNAEDGRVYILLGMAYSNYQVELFLEHPIYYFKDGAIRQWTNQDTTALKLGTSTIGGSTQGIFLNQGVPTACLDFETMYIRYIASLYGAVRDEQTGLWSYYYIRCARYDSDQDEIVWDRQIGYDDITDEEIAYMVKHRLEYLSGCYGRGTAMHSRIAFHVIGYGNNGNCQGCAYIGNRYLQTYGYCGSASGGAGEQYVPYTNNDTLNNTELRHLIGRMNGSSDFTLDSTATKLEYITFAPRKNNHKLNYAASPNIEFVSIYYTVTNGDTYTGCQLTLHPDVYAKIFDSTNADYTLWHKIDLANQARTNPITIQSA